MTDPINYFRNKILPYQVSSDPFKPIDVDELFGFVSSDHKKFMNVLSESCMESKSWVRKNDNFSSLTEISLQIMVNSFASLEQNPGTQEVIVRIIQSPRLSPLIQGPFNDCEVIYLICPTGWLAAIQSFVFRCYALGFLGVLALRDSTIDYQKSFIDPQIILKGKEYLCSVDSPAFLAGVMECIEETHIGSILGNFDDIFSFMAYDRNMQNQMKKFGNLNKPFHKYGFSKLSDSLDQYPKIKIGAISTGRALIALVIAHELSHIIINSATIKADEQFADISTEEGLADSIGVGLLWRLHELKKLTYWMPATYENVDLINGIFAFHSWNLCKQLSSHLNTLNRSKKNYQEKKAFDQVCYRYAKSRNLMKQSIGSLPSILQNQKLGDLLATGWDIIPTGVLQLCALSKKGSPLGADQMKALIADIENNIDTIWDIVQRKNDSNIDSDK
jgi:hypothetical protein